MIKFNEKYKPETFSLFLQDFLPEDYIEKEKDITELGRCKIINEVKEIGHCDSINVTVLEMGHSKETDPRIAIATDAFKILATYGIDKALVIFKNNETENYRFSYLTISLDVNDKNKVVRKYSNARRYSFYLGVDAKVKTPEQQLIKKERIKDAEDLLSRFSVEVVNKQFYLEVAKFFDALVSDEVENFRMPSQVDKNIRKSFAVRLIGRIMFCWFLKQKKTEKGQLIPDELLSSQVVTDNYYHNVLEPLFFEVLNTAIDERDIRSKEYDEVPYLNGGLFSPQSEDYYELDREIFISRYINTLKINDEWFKSFFELLETYNFTIDENTIFDQELSVDPEMLGRIFENLLAEINPETGSSERKRTGSFYTPRQIVEYMVDQSLIEYLKTKTSINNKKLRALLSYDEEDDLIYPLTNEDKVKIVDAVETLKILDPACGSGAFPIGALQKIVYILQTADPEGVLWRDKKLKSVPELYRKKIEEDFDSQTLDYIRKLEVIKNSIFGVDIQPIAVEVSRLRCFLTLVVESEIVDTKKNRGIQALPNLDFKFVCANSLIPAPEQDKNENRLFGDDFQKNLALVVDKYFSSAGVNKVSAGNEIHKLIDGKVDEKLKHLESLVSYNGDKKIEAVRAKTNKKQIDHHARTLSLWGSYKNIFENKPVGFFDTRYFFPTVHQNGGFDIVIGNPPYIGEKGHKELFREIKNTTLGNRFYQGKMDLFYFFFHVGLDNLHQNGVLAFITTNYYPTAPGGKKLREDIKSRSIIEKLVNFNELKIFKSAAGQHNMVTILVKGQDYEATSKTCITKHTGDATPDILESIISWQDERTNYFVVKQKDLYDGVNYDIRIAGTSTEDQDPIQTTLSKIKDQGVLLGLICNVNQGIVTGADKTSRKHIEKYKINAHIGDGIFVLTDSEVNALNLIAKDEEILRPWFKNSDIYRWNTKITTNENVLYLDRSKEYVENKIEAHLKKYIEIIKHRREVENGTIKWWKLQWPRKKNIFEGAKIVVPQRSPRNTFGYNDIPWYASADVYFLTRKVNDISLKYLLALLNSKPFYLWLYYRGKRKGEMLELYQTPLSEIPIKKTAETDQKQFIEIVDKILAISKSSDFLENSAKKEEVKKYEKQIDQLVYKLYDLTPEEIMIVETSYKNKKG